MSRRVLLFLSVAVSISLASCGKSATESTSGGTTTRSASSDSVAPSQPTTGLTSPGGTQAGTVICGLITSAMSAPDSGKTELIRKIAADPEAASFAKALIFMADLRDSSRGVPVSTVPGGLKLGDPELQKQTDLFRAFARERCGIADDLLK